MSARKVVPWALGLFALAILIPVAAQSQDLEMPAWLQAEEEVLSTDAQATGSSDDASLTLEEVMSQFGAHNVCGAPCGQFQPKCFVSCGDAAACRHGYCIYL